MTVKVETLLGLHKWVSKFVKPVMSSLLRNWCVHPAEPKSGADCTVDMATKLQGCDCAQSLCSKICVNTLNNGRVVKEGELAVKKLLFQWRKLAVLHQVSFVLMNPACAILILAQLPHNCKTCIEAWLFASIVFLVCFLQFHKLKDSIQLDKCLECSRCIVIFHSFQAQFDDFHYICWPQDIITSFIKPFVNDVIFWCRWHFLWIMETIWVFLMKLLNVFKRFLIYIGQFEVWLVSKDHSPHTMLQLHLQAPISVHSTHLPSCWQKSRLHPQSYMVSESVFLYVAWYTSWYLCNWLLQWCTFVSIVMRSHLTKTL